MVAVNQDTGTVEWDTPIPSSPYGAATVTNDVVFTTTFHGDLFALDAGTGKILLKTPLSAGTNAPVAVDGDYVIARSGRLPGPVPAENDHRLQARRDRQAPRHRGPVATREQPGRNAAEARGLADGGPGLLRWEGRRDDTNDRWRAERAGVRGEPLAAGSVGGRRARRLLPPAARPRPRPGFVPRPRLAERLDDGLAQGLVLVCARRPDTARPPCWRSGYSAASIRSPGCAWIQRTTTRPGSGVTQLAALDGVCSGIGERVGAAARPARPVLVPGPGHRTDQRAGRPARWRPGAARPGRLSPDRRWAGA